ncbi:ATPase-like protein, partial [mine drainage metagenome]
KEERLLDACWRRVKKGERKSVWITGEPGIGKSRFLSEFLSRVLAERGEAIVRELRCLPEDREIPWAPALRLFRSLLEISSDLSRADVILRSERYLKSLGRTTQEELSLFLHFLEGEGPWSKNLSRDSPGRIRQKIELLVSELVAKRSQNRPLILVIEDLHWIDFATVSLLLKSALSSPAHRLMVLFTSRDPSHLSGSFPQPDLHIPLAPLSP